MATATRKDRGPTRVPPPPASGGGVLLHVEDDPGERRLLAASLRRTGLELDVLVAEDLQAACETVAAQPVDVVLLDLGLPDSQGTATVEAILHAAPSVPLVVLTGLDDEATGVEALRLDAPWQPSTWERRGSCLTPPLLPPQWRG